MWSRINIIVLAAALGAGAVARGNVKVGDDFPAFAGAGLVNLAGGDVPARSGKVVLVDFWASWCVPCKESFPAMAKLHSEYAGRGLQIVAVSVDTASEKATAFWKKMAPPFVTLLDRERKLADQVDPPATPTSYLIGRDGKVRFVRDGFHEKDVPQIRKEIESLLDEKI